MLLGETLLFVLLDPQSENQKSQLTVGTAMRGILPLNKTMLYKFAEKR
jgi:hypothetical protein